MKGKIGRYGRMAVAAVLLAATASLAVIASCSGPTFRAYEGPVLPDAQTAVIRSGAYTRVESCDGVRVRSPYLNVAVLPGSHILSIAFVKRAIGNRLLYSNQAASVAFVAKPNRTYLVYAAPVPESAWHDLVVREYNWVGYVTDAGSGEHVAETAPLPLRAELISPLYQNNPL